jgi:hypothetical protein
MKVTDGYLVAGLLEYVSVGEYRYPTGTLSIGVRVVFPSAVLRSTERFFDPGNLGQASNFGDEPATGHEAKFGYEPRFLAQD